MDCNRQLIAGYNLYCYDTASQQVSPSVKNQCLFLGPFLKFLPPLSEGALFAILYPNLGQVYILTPKNAVAFFDKRNLWPNTALNLAV